MKQLGHYVVLEDENNSKIFVVCTDKEDGDIKIQDLYLMTNFENNDQSSLAKIILAIYNCVFSYAHNQQYIDENGNTVAIEDAGTYETYKQAGESEWTANATYTNNEDDDNPGIYECVISGTGATEVEAFQDCLKVKQLFEDCYNYIIAELAKQDQTNTNEEQQSTESKESEENDQDSNNVELAKELGYNDTDEG